MFKRLLPFIFVTFLMFCAPAWALDIKEIRIGTQPEKDRVVIELSKPTKFRAFVLQNPNRVIVDMDAFSWEVKSINRPTGTLVKDVRYGDLGAGKGRLVIETNKPIIIKSAFAIGKTSDRPERLVIDFKATSADTMKEATTQTHGALDKSTNVSSSAAKSKKEVQQSEPVPVVPKPNKAKLIIIDPGHGGQDPGAIGVNGVYEKTIALSVGLELRNLLRKSGYRVEMTRSTDVFIPLRQRVKFARNKKADLFISIHADSIGRSYVSGASVYTLSDKASDKETEKLAERENKSDLIAGIDLSHQDDDVADILLDLAARDTMNQSRLLARTILDTFDSSGVKILDKKSRSAGFAVLKAMDIPSVLVEMGYLTNRQEVEKLSDSTYQSKIARSLKSGVDRYFQKSNL